MPAKKKSGGQQQQQNKKANSAAARHQQLVQDEPPTAAEALLNELFAENVRIVRDKTATAADVNQHIEKLHAMILKFGAALSPVATSIADALTPFLLARPPTVESAWLAASTAAVLIPSVGAAIFPAIIDHLAGSVDVQIGTIASTQSFSKEHGAAVIRDVFFRDLVALHQQYNTNSNSDAAENNNIANDFSISKVRQCLRRISMTALPLLKPDQRVRYCFLMTQVLASATSSESRNSTLSLFGEDSAKHIYTSKNLEQTKSSTVIDLLELASTALLLSRPAVVGVLVESINNLVARVKQARWCASAVSVHEACMTAAGVCSAILHPMASPSSLTGAEPAGDLLMASLSNSNNNNNNSSTSTSATMHASPMFARSAVMPSNATSISSAAIITAHANNHSTTFVAVSSSTTTTTAKKASLPAVSFASDQQLVQGPPALLSSSRSAPARRSRSASRHDENGNAIEQNEIGNEGDDNDGSDLGDWDDGEDFAIPSSVDGSASKSNVAIGGKSKMGSKIKDKNESSGSKKSVSMSVPQNSAVSSNSHHHTTRVAPSPSPANVAANDSSNTNAFNDVAAGNIMFGSNSSFSSSSALNNATSKQQSDGRSRALSRVNNASVAPTHTNNNSNTKIIMRGQPSTSPAPEHRSGAQKVSLVTEGSMSPKTAVVNNSNNANCQKADDDDDEDDDAGDIAI